MRSKRMKPISFRLNLLFLFVFLTFTVLILRLGIVQIVHGEMYKEEVERTEEVEVSNSVPRGKIYDRNYQLVVDNEPLNTITYTRSTSSTQAERLSLAKKLAKIIEVDTNNVTERDIKDYWMLTRPDEAKQKITDNEKKLLTSGDISDKEIYQRQLERISEDDLTEIRNEEMEVIAIKREMDSGYALTPHVIKKGATNEEIAYISEHLSEFPGINVTTDWDRRYVYDMTLKTLLGNVSSQNEGLPNDLLNYYLVRDYSRNDRVGTSYIEQQYEEVLQGEKTKIKNITDQAGNIIDSKVIAEGSAGKDLILTIDMELQQQVEKIIEEELLKAKKQPGTELLDRAFVVMMDPNTGQVLTMAGKKIVKGEGGAYELEDFALGTMTTSYTMGSAVKGATVLAGFEAGVISPGTVFVDEPLYIKGSPPKKSWKTMGAINDVQALKMSSNVYMFKTAIAMGGGEYKYQQALPLDISAFSTMRYYFSQFGLGVPTGIDLPNEAIGYKGQSTTPGLLLDLSIGQYDTYTTLQLAQYISTIANGGYRMKPQIVKEIRDSEPKEHLGSIIESVEPEILNRVDMDEKYIDRVQEGLRQVFLEKGGTGYSYFSGAEYRPAGKTGTAEAFYDGPNKEKFLESTYNLTLVGYAPYDDPKVAFSVVVPWAYQGASNDHAINKIIGRKVLDAYFKLQEQKVQGKNE
ncbi:penicillin-binding protein 2 [Bacillus sp. FJAT-47783]|uniref:peptidoglycan D,D-transpeptidase FtsI family protein n=1 Tax=Bacillus sp. FJAT-47783 TaxID=2922712 RepID=UPI001FAC73DB|nr:penicillin-binding protein 2 [Bacillus sp. FJAT-47783]